MKMAQNRASPWLSWSRPSGFRSGAPGLRARSIPPAGGVSAFAAFPSPGGPARAIPAIPFPLPSSGCAAAAALYLSALGPSWGQGRPLWAGQWLRAPGSRAGGARSWLSVCPPRCFSSPIRPAHSCQRRPSGWRFVSCGRWWSRPSRRSFRAAGVRVRSGAAVCGPAGRPGRVFVPSAVSLPARASLAASWGRFPAAQRAPWALAASPPLSAPPRRRSRGSPAPRPPAVRLVGRAAARGSRCGGLGAPSLRESPDRERMRSRSRGSLRDTARERPPAGLRAGEGLSPRLSVSLPGRLCLQDPTDSPLER